MFRYSTSSFPTLATAHAPDQTQWKSEFRSQSRKKHKKVTNKYKFLAKKCLLVFPTFQSKVSAYFDLSDSSFEHVGAQWKKIPRNLLFEDEIEVKTH
jgi:hypothetical protein